MQTWTTPLPSSACWTEDITLPMLVMTSLAVRMAPPRAPLSITSCCPLHFGLHSVMVVFCLRPLSQRIGRSLLTSSGGWLKIPGRLCGSPVHFLSWGVPPLLMLTYGISRSGLTSSLSLLRDARWMLMRHGLLSLRRTLYSPADARVNRSLLATGGVEANQNSALAHLFAWLGVPCGVMRMPDGWSELDLALRSFAINGSSVITTGHTCQHLDECPPSPHAC